MNPFEEAGDLAKKIIIFAVILMVPGTVFVYSIVGDAFLTEAGHETTGNAVSSVGNVYGEATTTLGSGILQVFMASPLLFFLLCLVYVVVKNLRPINFRI